MERYEDSRVLAYANLVQWLTWSEDEQQRIADERVDALLLVSDTARSLNTVVRAQLLQADAHMVIDVVAERLTNAIQCEEALVGEARYLDYEISQHVYLLAACAFVRAATTPEWDGRATQLARADEWLVHAMTFLGGNLPTDKRYRYLYTTMRVQIAALLPATVVAIHAAAQMFFATTDAMMESYDPKQGHGRRYAV